MTIAAAVLTAALSAVPAIWPVAAMRTAGCSTRVYYLPFPPKANGTVVQPPVVEGKRETDDSFVVTVERISCPWTPAASARAGVDNPGQPIVTWHATVKPTEPDKIKPPLSSVKGPTFKRGPDSESIVEHH